MLEHGHGSARDRRRARSLVGAGAGYAVKPRRRRGRARLLPGDQGRHAGAQRESAPDHRGRLLQAQRAAADLESARHSGARPGPRAPLVPRGPPGPSGGAGDCDLERRITAAVPGFQPTGRCAPPPLCNDDGFEPNDTPTQAIVVDLGTTTSAIACAVNDDFFAVAAGGSAVPGLAVVRHRCRARGRAARQRRQRPRERRRQQSPEHQHARARWRAPIYVRVRAVGNAQGSATRSRSDGYRGALMALYDLPLDELETTPLRRARAARPGRVLGAHAGRGARARRTPARFAPVPPGGLRRARRRRRDLQRLRRRSDPRLVPAPARRRPHRCRAS